MTPSPITELPSSDTAYLSEGQKQINSYQKTPENTNKPTALIVPQKFDPS